MLLVVADSSTFSLLSKDLREFFHAVLETIQRRRNPTSVLREESRLVRFLSNIDDAISITLRADTLSRVAVALR